MNNKKTCQSTMTNGVCFEPRYRNHSYCKQHCIENGIPVRGVNYDVNEKGEICNVKKTEIKFVI